MTIRDAGNGLIRDECEVREMMEHKGKLLIAMGYHDGLFQVPPDRPDLLARIKQALASKKKLSFTYDRDLFIRSID